MCLSPSGAPGQLSPAKDWLISSAMCAKLPDEKNRELSTSALSNPNFRVAGVGGRSPKPRSAPGLPFGPAPATQPELLALTVHEPGRNVPVPLVCSRDAVGKPPSGGTLPAGVVSGRVVRLLAKYGLDWDKEV